MISGSAHGILDAGGFENVIAEGPSAGVRHITVARWIHQDASTPTLTVRKHNPKKQGTLEEYLLVRSPRALASTKDLEWLAPVVTLRPGERLIATLDTSYTDTEAPTTYYMTWVDLTDGVR